MTIVQNVYVRGVVHRARHRYRDANPAWTVCDIGFLWVVGLNDSLVGSTTGCSTGQPVSCLECLAEIT